MTIGKTREDDIMTKKLLEEACERNNIEIEISTGDGLFEVSLAAPDGWLFDTDLRYLVEEHDKAYGPRNYRQRAYEVMYNRLMDYLPLKPDVFDWEHAYSKLEGAIVGDSVNFDTDDLVELIHTMYDKSIVLDKIMDWHERMQLKDENIERMNWMLEDINRNYEDYNNEVVA